MSRLSYNLILIAVVFALTSQVTFAASPARWNPNKTKSKSNPSRSNSSGQMPNTERLDGEMASVSQSLDALAARISSIEKSVEAARKSAQDVASMIRTIGKIEAKITRIRNQLHTVSRIPQLRMIKPMVTNLDKLRKQLHTVRVKADQANKDYVQPAITKLTSAERKLETKVSEIRNASNQAKQARQNLAKLRNFVASQGYPRAAVNTLEAVARPASNSIRPVHQMISELDRSLSGVDRNFNSVARQFRNVTTAKRALQKLDQDLAKADKVARDLDKVLSKSLTIKLGVKKITISVRKVLEAPGKILDIFIKPLEKMAKKALDPVLSKAKVNISLPREITALTQQLDGLRNVMNQMNSPISKIETAMRNRVPQQFQNEMNKLMKMSTSQLGR